MCSLKHSIEQTSDALKIIKLIDIYIQKILQIFHLS